MFDIVQWYSENEGVCNHCGESLLNSHPGRNIYPHFSGACIRFPPSPAQPSLFQRLKNGIQKFLS